MANFEKAFKKVLGFEGGYTNNKYDSGGETKYGITIEDAQKHKYFGDMKDLPLDFAKKIYKIDYWDKIQGDEINSQKISESLFNIGVNMGVKRSAFFMQQVLNALNDKAKYWEELKVDGIFGKTSVGVLNYAVKKKDYMEDNINFFFLTKAGNKYYEIVVHKESQEIFLNGWIRRLREFV